MRTATSPKIGYLLHGARTFARDTSLCEALQEDYELTTFTPPEGSYSFQLRWLWDTVQQYPELRWIAGYQTHRFVPWLRLFCRKPVLYNALCSLYEGAVLDRIESNPLKRLKIWLIDFFAFSCSSVVLVETFAQVFFLASHFLQRKEKLRRVFTGLPASWLLLEPPTLATGSFHVVFRGGLQPYLGLETILAAADLLRNEPVRWTIMGRGPLQSWLETEVEKRHNSAITLRTDFIPEAELQEILRIASVALGPVSNHSRARRTIPNKIFEYLALGVPIVAAKTESLEEILTDHQNALLIEPGSAQALAEALVELMHSPSLRLQISKEGQKTLSRTCSPEALKLVLDPIMRTWLRDA